MTFQDWYAANIEPTLPTDVPEPIRQNARESMAACWNAAIDACDEWLVDPKRDTTDHPDFTRLRALISTFGFQRQRLRQ